MITNALRGVFLDNTIRLRNMSLQTYIKDTKSELKHVTWPTRQQTINFTLIVIGMSVFIGVLLGAFDLFFTYLLKIFIF